MCGIAGFIGPGTREDLVRMTGRLVDRGPDAAGYWEGGGVFLGHRRLSILDIEGGAQPMWSADESCGIVFNGEIYNFAELRAELAAAGRVFRTDHSDTEVLLEAYAEWGDEMVHRLNGMWAFVIFDRGHRRLFASRDRFGKKPFYYHHAAGRGSFVFASELNALLEHPGVSRAVSAPAVRKYFAYGYVPAPLAMTEGAKKLPGGHSLSVDIRTAKLRVWRYWDYQPEPDAGGTPAEWREELRRVLGDAVRRRMVADAARGVPERWHRFVVGGVFGGKGLPKGALQTFSIGFDEPTYDELPFAARVAEWIGSRHRRKRSASRMHAVCCRKSTAGWTSRTATARFCRPFC